MLLFEGSIGFVVDIGLSRFESVLIFLARLRDRSLDISCDTTPSEDIDGTLRFVLVPLLFERSRDPLSVNP